MLIQCFGTKLDLIKNVLPLSEYRSWVDVFVRIFHMDSRYVFVSPELLKCSFYERN